MPNISINHEKLNVISSKYKIRLNGILNVIEEKLIHSLIKVGVKKDDLFNAMEEIRNKFNNLNVIDEFNKEYIETVFNKYNCKQNVIK